MFSVPSPEDRAATSAALRVGLAVGLCMLLVEWWKLPHGNQAVWTTHMVLVQYPFTAFQKGAERVLGRALGILLGVVLVTLFHASPLVVLALEGLAIAGFFYFYFAGRLAYTFLNAGLYLGVTVLLGRADPDHTWAQGWGLTVAITLGVVVADLVAWATGLERDFRIQFGEAPLLPIRRDWLSRALMLAVATLLTQVGTELAGLPASQAVVAIMVVGVAPGLSALATKGALRVLGALLGGGWSLGSFLLLTVAPHFALLVLLVSMGCFLGAYLARFSSRYSYAGVQMGLVIPMLLVGPPTEVGNLVVAGERILGAALALTVGLLVEGLWPRVEPPASPSP